MQNYEKSVLFCLSPAPSNRIIIRAAAEMFRGGGDAKLVALFVETPDYVLLAQADKDRLKENMELAREAGAEVVIITGKNVPFEIAEYARSAGISRIVMGQSILTGSRLLPQPDLSEQLLQYLPEVELHVIPDGKKKAKFRMQREEQTGLRRIGIVQISPGGRGKAAPFGSVHLLLRREGDRLDAGLHPHKTEMFLPVGGNNVDFEMTAAPVARQNGMAQPLQIAAGDILAHLPCSTLSALVSRGRFHDQPNLTTVTPDPPKRISSSATETTPGTVRRYFWISSRRAPVPFPWRIRTCPTDNMRASSA